MEDVGVSDIEIAKLLAEQRGAKIKFIRPTKPLLTDSLKITKITQAKMMELGRKAARKAGKLEDCMIRTRPRVVCVGSQR